MLKKDEILFKDIEEKKTCIKAKYKNSANIAITQLSTNLQGKINKKNFV